MLLLLLLLFCVQRYLGRHDDDKISTTWLVIWNSSSCLVLQVNKISKWAACACVYGRRVAEHSQKAIELHHK